MDVYTLMGELKTKYFELLNSKEVYSDREKVEEIEYILKTIQEEIHKIERARWKVAHYEMMNTKHFYDV